MTSYAFDNAVALTSTERFDSLQHCYDAVSFERLTMVGVGPSWRCLEVGAGGGSVANWLGRRVGAGGSVVATDIDLRLVGEVAGNVELWCHDVATDPLPEAAFDLVHARLVLLHLPGRHAVLQRIRRALKPGGVVVLEDFDCTWLPVLAAPDASAARLFGKVVGGVHEVLRRAGADLAWGSNAYGALAEAGFVDLDVYGHSEVWMGGTVGAHLHRANVRQAAGRLVAQGLASQTEIDDFLDLIEDPRFAVSSYLMMSTTGRRPFGSNRNE